MKAVGGQAPSASFPILAILFVCADCITGNDRERRDAGDAEVLLQTNYRTQSSRLETTKPRQAAAGDLTDAAGPKSTCRHSYTADIMLNNPKLVAMGHGPFHEDCGEEVLLLPQLAHISRTYQAFHIPPITLVIVFGALSFLLIAMIFHAIYQVHTKDKAAESKYPEADAWKRSVFDWLWMGWATQWIARWGTANNASLTKISAKDIPLSDPDDECELCFRKFEQIWKEEISRAGFANASLLKVVTRFVTYRKVFAIGFWNAFYEGFLFMGPPLAIKWVTRYMNWLYTQRGLGIDVSGDALIGPSLLLILIFAGLPTMMAISNSMCTMLNGRISIRLDGALSLAVYDKAQRLPVVQEDSDDITLKDGPGKKKGSGKASDTPKTEEDEMFESETVSEMEQLEANNGVAKRFNLVQVVSNDINTNLMMIPNSLARMVVMIPVLFGTLCMLINEIGWAFLFSLGMAVLNLFLMTCVGFMMRNSLVVFYNTSGKRLQFLQEVVAGIRFIKGCGAETIVAERLNKARAKEIRSLDVFYTIQCFMFVLALQFPKLYLLVSLAGYAVFHHGMVEPTVIMSLIPLLMSVQGAIAVVFSLIPMLVLALPSCRRLETFLKLKEAPRVPALPLNGLEATAPPHLTLTSEEETGPLRVQGDFSWRAGEAAVLHSVDVALPRGGLTAVVGPVGCGKSTLLHAVLGELFPHGDARVEVPGRMAYSSQLPHLFEGSLRDNVLKGDIFDAIRYKEAIRAACLAPDLEMLPGGDEVPVGGRGVTLSGGQKARVSMARAAYDRADLVLLDDPFAAVDAQTARHLNEQLLHGPLLRGRTRLVACQPDAERIRRFDWVVLLREGRVTAQGPPAEILRSEAYRSLLCSAAQGVSTGEEEQGAGRVAGCGGRPGAAEAFELREEECEGRASWATIAYFGRMGGWIGISTCIVFYLIKNVLDMRTQVQLSLWMSHGSLYDAGLTIVAPSPKMYIMGYMFWMGASTVAWFICWAGGQSWTLRISEGCHEAMIKALLHAPVDRFYDKTPVGRIMNRMANDMMNVDMQVFVGCCSTIGMIWSMSVPIYYVHLTMPLWFSVLTVPFYYLVVTLICLYWKTMVPLRYLMQVSKSAVSSEIADVESTPATVRAYSMEAHRLGNFTLAVRKMIAADFLGRIICIRWLCNRLFVLGGCFVTGLALLCVWIPGALDVGSASLVINTMFQIIVSIEANIATGSMAQYQIIAMNRIYEYTSLPEEREQCLSTDKTFQNITVTIARASMGILRSEVNNGKIEISREAAAGDDLILLQLAGRTAFVAAPGKRLPDLAPKCVALRGTESWHRVVAVNGAHKTAEEVVEELCEGDSPDVTLHVQSGWLADGVRVEVQDLRVGYADVPCDVLHSVNISIPRRCKAGVVGPTGCGKSTLLLSMLRMLEPRSGRICLEGVDTQTLGLQTLRMSLGLVPQDPVLLQGTLRFNIDPFELYSDERIWEALDLVQMRETVEGMSGGLDFSVSGEGTNLSFGQRQLLSLARNIVRKPMLLLLDEATSAIDPRTQELLQETLKAAFPDSTMVVIAHRLETILDFDLVVVMDGGRVVEKGAVKELAKTPSGRFAKLLAAKGLSV